jgi:hypothetical protein
MDLPAAAVFLAALVAVPFDPVLAELALRVAAFLAVVFATGAVVVAGAAFRAVPVRLAVAVAERLAVPVWAATERLGAPAFAVPVDLAICSASVVITEAGFAALVLVLLVALLLAVVVPTTRLAAGLVVASSVAAIVSSPLCRRLPLVRWRVGRVYASSPSQRASSASQVSLRSRTRSRACSASSAELYGPSRSTAGQMLSLVSTR